MKQLFTKTVRFQVYNMPEFQNFRVISYNKEASTAVLQSTRRRVRVGLINGFAIITKHDKSYPDARDLSYDCAGVRMPDIVLSDLAMFFEGKESFDTEND